MCVHIYIYKFKQIKIPKISIFIIKTNFKFVGILLTNLWYNVVFFYHKHGVLEWVMVELSTTLENNLSLGYWEKLWFLALWRWNWLLLRWVLGNLCWVYAKSRYSPINYDNWNWKYWTLEILPKKCSQKFTSFMVVWYYWLIPYLRGSCGKKSFQK